MKNLSIISALLLAGIPFASIFADTESDFQNRRKGAADSSVFNIFSSKELTGDRLDAMKFLYAYMPLPDISGHPDTFFLANVDATLRAREEMPWGKKVPEREWRHFVLPLRVNNENLDMARPVFYEELKDRVKGLSMKDAILEVNHWCHEKVTYQPSDARTSSPLSTVSQAIGRCGEESTFTVAALRSVGIPARQVYTPRWAHTDDNHAWVEAWADGEWYFLGACEPAPVLDMAWFNAPASRGMLMTTNVFGRYDGPEEKLIVEPLNTTINVTSKYAPVATMAVEVVDEKGRPVKDATVNFTIYNYAEFYPVATKRSDAEGKASLTAGLGDMVVWASDGTNFGWSKGKVGDGTVKVVLDKNASSTASFDLNITPPKGGAKLPSPSKELVDANDRRLQQEDSIRNAYTSTFVTEEEVNDYLIYYNTTMNREKTHTIFSQARGNGRTLMKYLTSIKASRRDDATKLLYAVTEKDRRDIPIEVIEDCIDNTTIYCGLQHKIDYIFSPRIASEALTPFKGYFRQVFGDELLKTFWKYPDRLVKWVADSIRIETESNPRLIQMDPRAVWRERHCDPRSRDIFFVAVARTAAIPARIDPVTGKPQYLHIGTKWNDAVFSSESDNKPKTETGTIDISYSQVGRIDNPKYYSQFSISRIDGGLPHLLEYPEGDGWKEIQSGDRTLDAGQYLMVTGQRMADGSVLAHGELFNVAPSGNTPVDLVLRQDDSGVQVIGGLNAENLYQNLSTGETGSLLATTGRGYYVVGLIRPGDEPSAHALNDISARRDELEKWGRPILLLFADEESASRFDMTPYKNLPSTVTFGIDKDGASLKELVSTLNLENSSLPIFVIADTFNRVVFATQGYTIGLGDRIADTAEKLKE